MSLARSCVAKKCKIRIVSTVVKLPTLTMNNHTQPLTIMHIKLCSPTTVHRVLRFAPRTHNSASRTEKAAIRTEKSALRTKKSALRTKKSALRTERSALLPTTH